MSEDKQEEAIARALQKGNPIWARIARFFRKLVARLRRDRTALAGLQAEEAFQSGALWERTPEDAAPDRWERHFEEAIELAEESYSLTEPHRDIDAEVAAFDVPEDVRNEARNILKQATAQKQSYIQAVKAASVDAGVEFMAKGEAHAVKGTARTIEKLLEFRRSGKNKTVTDALRATSILRASPTNQQVDTVSARMRFHGFVTVDMENLFETPRLGNYRHVQMKFQKPGQSLISELLLIQPQMLKVKNGLGHVFYEIDRVKMEALDFLDEAMTSEVALFKSDVSKLMNDLYEVAFLADNLSSASAMWPMERSARAASGDIDFPAFLYNSSISSKVRPLANRFRPLAISSRSPASISFLDALDKLSAKLPSENIIPQEGAAFSLTPERATFSLGPLSRKAEEAWREAETFARELWGQRWEIAGWFKEERGKRDPSAKADLGVADTLVRTMLYYADKVPTLRRVFDAAMTRQDNAYAFLDLNLGVGKDDDHKRVRDLIALSKEAYARLSEYLFEKDRAAEGYHLRPVEIQTLPDGTKRVTEWELMAPADEKGQREKIGRYTNEDAGWHAAYELESLEYGPRDADGNPIPPRTEEEIKLRAAERAALLAIRRINHRTYAMLRENVEQLEAMY